MSDEELGQRIEALTNAILQRNAEDAANKAGLAGAPGAIQDAIRAELSKHVAPSKAAQIGDGSVATRPASRGDAHPVLKAHLGGLYGNDYVPGSLITSLWNAKSSDMAEQMAGKAGLAMLGLEYRDAPEKATLGTTGATGGYVLPNNLVDEVEKPAVGAIDWPAILTVRDGVMVRGVDAPYRLGPPARMTSQDWGATKENVNETYGSYTANLVTFARIYDVAKQYLRFSAGAAERDVMDELGKAARLTVEYEVLAGPGTGTVGSGDACLGVYTSLNATPTWLGYKGAKTNAASNSTVLGSFTAACAELLKLLAARSRFPNAIVLDAVTYFAILAQGSDTAGYFTNPTVGGGLMLQPDGGLAYLGVPIRWSPNFDSYTGTTKAMIGGDFKAVKLFRGAEFRIDSSDVAGTRWDQNLVGFRGEMEMGFNAETAVHTGALQLMTAVIP